jgi:DNA-binding SARP family transcriptional activator
LAILAVVAVAGARRISRDRLPTLFWPDSDTERARGALLARSAHAVGDAEKAARWWRQLAVADPVSGRVALALVNALAAAGEREAAIRHAETYAARVREELEVEPDPDVALRAEELRRVSARPHNGATREPEGHVAAAEPLTRRLLRSPPPLA